MVFLNQQLGRAKAQRRRPTVERQRDEVCEPNDEAAKAHSPALGPIPFGARLLAGLYRPTEPGESACAKVFSRALCYRDGIHPMFEAAAPNSAAYLSNFS